MSLANTWVVVADAARATMYRQPKAGAPLEAALDHDLIGDARKSSAHGTDRPGRVHERVGSARHAMEGPDLQRIARAEFAHEIAAELLRASDDGKLEHIVIVAPPGMLGELRNAMAARVRERVVAEIGKDLAHLPPHELPSHLADVLHFATPAV